MDKIQLPTIQYIDWRGSPKWIKEKPKEEEKENENASGRKSGVGERVRSWHQDLRHQGLAPRPLPRQCHDARVLAPMALAPCHYILAPVTMVPRAGSIFWNLSTRGTFESLFQKKAKKQKDGHKSVHCPTIARWCIFFPRLLLTILPWIIENAKTITNAGMF
jgi:hypothetical protein